MFEGNLAPTGSYGLVNLNLAHALAQLGHEVSLVGFDIESSRLADVAAQLDPPVPTLTIGESSQPTEVRIRQSWPPYWERRDPDEKLVVIQPWEFGSVPLEWLPGIANVDAIWVPSAYAKRGYLQSGIDHSKVFVVPNGVEDQAFRPLRAHDVRNGLKLVYVGGSIPRKGLDVLIGGLDTLPDAVLGQVALTIKEMGRDTFYRGQSILEDALASHPRVAARATVERRFLSRDDLLSLMADADVLAHTYRAEGFGLPVLEAMALGVPVLHTRGGATNEFCLPEFSMTVPSSVALSEQARVGAQPVVDQAYWLEPDVAELGASLERLLLGAIDLDAMAEKAQLNAVRYRWNEVAAIAFGALEALIARRSPDDALSRLVGEMDSLEFGRAGEVARVASWLVGIGDFSSAAQLAELALEQVEIGQRPMVAQTGATLARLRVTNPDVWSVGPFRSMIVSRGFRKNRGFGYVHDFEGDKEVTLTIATHLSKHFAGATSILDIGCGKGSMLRALRAQGKKVQGVEIDPHLVSELREDGFIIHPAYVPSGLDSLSVGHFDGAFLGHIVEHLTPTDTESLLEWLFEHIDDHGVVVIQTPNFQLPVVSSSNFWLDATHIRPYPVELLKAMLLNSGFVPVEGASRPIPEIAPLDIAVVARRIPRLAPRSALVSRAERPVVAHFGLFDGVSGFARASERLLDEVQFESSGVDLIRVNFGAETRAPFAVQPFAVGKDIVADVAIVDLPLGWIPEVSPRIQARRKIVRTTFEATPVPAEMVALLNGFDEVWSFSSFDREILIESGVDASRTHRIVPAMLEGGFEETTEVSTSSAPRGTDAVRFLSVFEFSERKDPAALLEAFVKVAAKGLDVMLTVKLSGITRSEFLAWYEAKEYPLTYLSRIEIIDQRLDETALQALYRDADVFVLPSRGEGFGLPFLEALLGGVPLVAPDVGGHRDFCDESNTVFVRSFPEVVQDGTMPALFHGTRWRAVDVDALADAMERMAIDDELRRTLAMNAPQVRERMHALSRRAEVTARLLAGLVTHASDEDPPRGSSRN
ncbi:MAG: glycosyltransferase [Acidimicrobiales bacterium]